jgi:hypothetical protein
MTASKRRLQDKDMAQELILDFDAHRSEDEDISPPQSDSDNEEDDRTETGRALWPDSSQFCSSALVIHRFTGGPSGLRQNDARNVNTLPH